MAEDDWAGWEALSRALDNTVQLVGDDVFVTQTAILAEGIARRVGNAILIKPNQVGTLTETLAAVDAAVAADYAAVISHRSVRNSGYIYRRSGGGFGRYPDQDRRAVPF